MELQLLPWFAILGIISQSEGNPLSSRSKFETKEDLPDTQRNLHRRDIGLTSSGDPPKPDSEYKWPAGILYYKISDGFNDHELALIEQAQNLIASRSENCIVFKESPENQGDYLQIVRVSTGCASNVGRQGGVQYLQLGDECFRTGHGVIAHEIMHVLGFFHEHVRLDRDDYITVHPEIIDPEKLSEFVKLRMDTYNLPYDYESILHYPRNSFGITGTEETITPRDSNARIGQRDHLSDGDVAKIKAYYECGIRT